MFILQDVRLIGRNTAAVSAAKSIQFLALVKIRQGGGYIFEVFSVNNKADRLWCVFLLYPVRRIYASRKASENTAAPRNCILRGGGLLLTHRY